MKGTATKVKIAGAEVSLGDYMEVEYTGGGEFRGATIKGDVVELWSSEVGRGQLQARLSSHWCFHDDDRILVHRKAQPDV